MKRPQLIALTLAGLCPPAHAINFNLGPVDTSFTNRLSIGAAWRLEDRDPALVGKLNLNPALCDGDDCLSFSDDADPNARLVAAPGSFVAHEMDDGNLNYEPGDLVAGVVKLTSDLRLQWRDISLKARSIAFFDAVNSDFEDSHPNSRYQPAQTARQDGTDELLGSAVELQDLVLSVPFTLGDNFYEVSLGQQKLRWGESNLIVLNSLNEVAPADGRRLHQPTFQINELFQPIPLAVIGGDLSVDLGLSFQAFYQFGWRPVLADPGGSFYGDVDALYKDEVSIGVGLGFSPEDPNRDKRFENTLAQLLSNSSLSAQVLDQEQFHPEDGGQYGLRVNWFSDFIFDGTEYGFYAMNYHSRLPYLSGMASDRSCLRDAVGSDYASLIVACEAFAVAGGGEPLPIDTMQMLFEYPEDIQMYGISFNTNLGKWSVAGEYAYRPNLPLQIAAVDIIFASLQPAFPAEDVVIGLEGLTGDLGGIIDAGLAPLLSPLLESLTTGYPVTVPGARNAVPDYLETRYRGHEVEAGQYIPGYERFAVDQLVLNGIRILGSSNPFSRLLGAEQTVVLLEAGVTHIWDLPDIDTLQLETSTPLATHRSPGADGSGQPDGQPDPRSKNPTQQTEGFVSEWSWGYRILAQLEYNDVFAGINLKPFLILSHDVSGYAPRPMQNFVEDRLDLAIGSDFNLGQLWSAKLQYNMHTGDAHHSKRDRDNIALEFSLTF